MNKLESPSPKDALCQVWLKLAQWLWRRRYLNFVNIFSIFQNYLLLGKGLVLPLNNLEGPSPRDELLQIWLKFHGWFGNFVNVFSLFRNSLKWAKNPGNLDKFAISQRCLKSQEQISWKQKKDLVQRNVHVQNKNYKIFINKKLWLLLFLNVKKNIFVSVRFVKRSRDFFYTRVVLSSNIEPKRFLGQFYAINVYKIHTRKSNIFFCAF